MSKEAASTQFLDHKERALLAIVDMKREHSDWSTLENEEEMRELVIACDGEVVDVISCPLSQPTPGTLIGSGKVEEIATRCLVGDVDAVIFSHDLKGSQQRNLEDMIKKKTIDRTQLILDIFARHAHSNEGEMQVELAQLEYLLPRLVGKGIELSRLGGGIGTRGPGETKLEVDRRRIAQKIDKLKKQLLDVSASRSLKRKKRKEDGLPAVSLVGYTNAGKSTLLNVLTGAGQITKDGLFTTLDSLSRLFVLPNHQRTVVSDTVGFMHDLPHRLIESFKATLEEVQEADLLLHVLDVSKPNFRQLHASVEGVLSELNALDKPTITILNKIDKLDERNWLASIQDHFKNSVCISAKSGENVPELLSKMEDMLSTLYIEVNVMIPIGRMDLINLAHEVGEVYSVKYYNDSINLRASLPTKFAGKFEKARLKDS